MYVLQFIQIYFLNCEFDDRMQANLGMHVPFSGYYLNGEESFVILSHDEKSSQ
jgi:hypothetical protein